MFGVIRQYLRNDQGDAPGGWQVQKLVRAMRVRMRPEHPGYDKLRLREFFPEHRHERDAAALPHVSRRRPEGELRASRERVLEPGRQCRRVPAGGARLAVEFDACAVRRVFRQRRAKHIAGLCRVHGGWQTQTELGGGERQQHVSGVDRGRQAVDAGDRQLRAPGPIEHQLGQIVTGRRHSGRERKFGVDRVPQGRRRAPRLRHPLRRDLGVELGEAHLPGLLVLDPGQ